MSGVNWSEQELAKCLSENQALRLNPLYSQSTDKPKAKDNKIPVPLEEEEQEAVAVELDSLGLLWFHPPNGGKRHKGVAIKMKKAGVKPGVPDIWIITPPPNLPNRKGVVIELKREKGGTVSPDQERWISELKRIGWHAVVCEGHREVVRVLRYCGYMK
jgi:hypothetical protein